MVFFIFFSVRAMKITNPDAPATINQLGLLCRMTKWDWAVVQLNPQNLTKGQAASTINGLIKAKKTGGKSKAYASNSQEVSIQMVIDRVIEAKKEVSTEYIMELVGKLKEQWVSVVE